jgi:serine/threonine-protein kinase
VKRLKDAGLDTEVTRHFSNSFDRGTVMGSDPDPGARVRGHGLVTLVISRGPEIIRVPDLAGLSLAEARSELRSAGLAAGIVTRSFDDGVQQGAVISSTPEPGSEVRPDAGISLAVSKGSPIEVPDVTGASVADATAGLEAAGLKVKVATERINSPQTAGSVAGQSPSEGAQLAGGDTVTLTVSKGPRILPVPDVTGEKVSDARDRLERAGFKVDVERGFPFLQDKVSEQSVQGGLTAPEGSTITIRTNGL